MSTDRRCWGATALLFGALLWTPAAFGQDGDRDEGFALSFGGLAFGDLYHVVANHLPDADGATGAVLRRGYLTLDVDMPSAWFARARIEINQAGEYETYTFEADFKDLHVGRDFGRHRVIAGLAPTPTFDLIEGHWGLRYLMRTPMDLQGVASRDVGLYAAGPFNASGSLSYRAMVGAGLEFGNETGDGRKFMGAVAWRPHERWVVDLYADYEKLSGPADRTTLQAFLGYQAERVRWGLQYSHQDRQEEPRLQLASGFVVYDFSDEIAGIVRVDRLIAPSPSGNNISYIPFAPEAPATMLLTAVELHLVDVFRMTPNVLFIDYDRTPEGDQPPSDLSLRLTLFLDLE